MHSECLFPSTRCAGLTAGWFKQKFSKTRCAGLTAGWFTQKHSDEESQLRQVLERLQEVAQLEANALLLDKAAVWAAVHQLTEQVTALEHKVGVQGPLAIAQVCSPLVNTTAILFNSHKMLGIVAAC